MSSRTKDYVVTTNNGDKYIPSVCFNILIELQKKQEQPASEIAKTLDLKTNRISNFCVEMEKKEILFSSKKIINYGKNGNKLVKHYSTNYSEKNIKKVKLCTENQIPDLFEQVEKINYFKHCLIALYRYLVSFVKSFKK